MRALDVCREDLDCLVLQQGAVGGKESKKRVKKENSESSMEAPSPTRGWMSPAEAAGKGGKTIS